MNRPRWTWQEHGPSDYAETVKLLAYESREGKGALNGTERRGLEWITAQFARAARMGGSAGWLYFSRARLAAAIGRCTRTADRVLRKLQGLGYLVRQFRGAVGKVWQTCITRPGARLLSLCYRVSHAKPQQIRRETQLSHDELKKRIVATPQAATIVSVLKTIQTHAHSTTPMPDGQALPGAAPQEEKTWTHATLADYRTGIESIRAAVDAAKAAKSSQEVSDDSAIAQRRALLKAQAARIRS